MKHGTKVAGSTLLILYGTWETDRQQDAVSWRSGLSLKTGIRQFIFLLSFLENRNLLLYASSSGGFRAKKKVRSLFSYQLL